MLCRVVLNWNLTPGVYKHEKKSDLHQSIWPEGFYDVRPASVLSYELAERAIEALQASQCSFQARAADMYQTSRSVRYKALN